jgi:hypothetical protein
MRPGQLRKLRYRDVIDHYGLILCDNPATCKRSLSVHQHDIGAYDRMGHIHWSRADTLTTRRGLRRLLVAIGGVLSKHSTRSIPEWQKLYEANLWAWKAALMTWHVQITQEMSKQDRLRAMRIGGRAARANNFAAYQWMRGRKKQWHK